MPNITTAATFTSATPGFSNLKKGNGLTYLLFTGSSVGTTTSVRFVDDAGVEVEVVNGNISSLPTFLEVRPPIDLKIVTTGTPNFNVTIVKSGKGN